MSTNLISSGTTAREKVNLRTPDVMAAVQQQVESHYRSDIVDKVRRAGGIISVGDTTVRLAKEFGFCYGVERAIDLAYAARKVFKDRQLFIVGEIIHNPEVNHQIASLGIRNLTGKNKQADISDLGPEDVVIVPAFGTELSIQQQIKDRGCQIVDTTCGDVMSVCKRSVWLIRPRCCAAKLRKCNDEFGRPLSIATGQSLLKRISDSSTQSAVRRKSGRMHCANCSTCQW